MTVRLKIRFLARATQAHARTSFTTSQDGRRLSGRRADRSHTGRGRSNAQRNNDQQLSAHGRILKRHFMSPAWPPPSLEQHRPSSRSQRQRRQRHGFSHRRRARWVGSCPTAPSRLERAPSTRFVETKQLGLEREHGKRQLDRPGHQAGGGVTWRASRLVWNLLCVECVDGEGGYGVTTVQREMGNCRLIRKVSTRQRNRRCTLCRKLVSCPRREGIASSTVDLAQSHPLCLSRI